MASGLWQVDRVLSLRIAQECLSRKDHMSLANSTKTLATPSSWHGTPPVMCGTLHAFVAFDWGDEIDLAQARKLVPAEVIELPRRLRTPTSFTYRPPPLNYSLPAQSINWPGLGVIETGTEAKLFDFAAVALAFRFCFRLPASDLSNFAGRLSDSAWLVKHARLALKPLYEALLPVIQHPLWEKNLSEEYFVFHLVPPERLAAYNLLESQPAWLASLVRLESDPLSAEEVSEACRQHLRYAPEDLFVPDWAAAVLIERDCEETLHAIEFANLQLVELRHIDNRLDKTLTMAYAMIHSLSRSWLPFKHTYGRSLRLMGELKVEANGLFERISNVLKLVGDQYLARVYRMVAGRFHLDDWQLGIQRKLEVAEGVYQVVSDQTDTYRSEFLELVVVILILLEIVVALYHH
jgi:hypothetical protein